MSPGMKPVVTPKRRTYGRAKGRPLSPHQTALMSERFPALEIKDDPLDGLQRFNQTWFEIGFGGAEHLIWQAQHNPTIAVLGAEPYLNGVAKAVVGVEQHSLTNIRLHHGDARLILDKLPHGSLDRVFVLFPDPWPKSRHNKRRIINETFVKDIHRVLKPGGTFRFASDIIHYVDWSLTRIFAHGGFEWSAVQSQDWRTRPDDWPQTRYEAKAIREGRPCHYFEFRAC